MQEFLEGAGLRADQGLHPSGLDRAENLYT
jgi:hypothetical protein